MTAARPDDAFAALPDPGPARTLDELVEGLRSLKVWAGDPSYESITSRVNDAWTAAGRPAGELTKRPTVADCFKPGRRRLNTDLVIAIVQALHPDVGYVTQWRQALQVIGGETRAASQVRVQDRLPPDLAGFTGRTTELEQLRRALHHGRRNGGAVVISAIEGMAGVGKTQLAIHAGHLLTREEPFDRVLFVNLRGFHPDPAQPPADPAAVLDGFMRLLGVPGHQIPHDLPARAAAYRGRLVGTHTLVVLDNAATADQVRPLLPETPGCLTLVTSRRSLTDLHPAAHLTVDVFTAEEAVAFLTQAASAVPVGDDPNAATRIAHRCGHLPLAVGLVAGHIRGTPGWTLTDHADRLDERHQQQHLDTGVQLALDLSYQHLPTDRRRLLRLAALHPGQDFDAHAAAALTESDLDTARTNLRHLCHDHLLQQSAPGRHTLHDLVRAYATGRASDEDPPAVRNAALTRLFDYYVITAAAAVNTLHPAEVRYRPPISRPQTPIPELTDADSARAWLDTERHTLVAVTAHTAIHGWPTHAIRLSTTLYRYLNGGHHADALTVHGHAHHAAHHTGDLTGQAHALNGLGNARLWLGQYGPATEQLQRALHLYRQANDQVGQAGVLRTLGLIELRQGRYRLATDHFERSLALFRQTGDRSGEARALGGLGGVKQRLGRHRSAADHHGQSLILFQQADDDRPGEAHALNNLGYAEVMLGRHEPGGEHLQRALSLFLQLGDRDGEGMTLDNLGTLHTRLGQPDQATEHHQRALAIVRETGQRASEAVALNGLGEAAHTAGRANEALTHHTAAHTMAIDVGDRDQQARAHAGLGRAYQALNQPTQARRHYQQALILYTDLGARQTDQIRAHLAAIDDGSLE